MKTDTYKVLTQKAYVETLSLAGYHSSCYRSYTATKRIQNPLPADEEEPVSKKVTRSVSELPKSDQQGLLKGACIFCGLSRKKLKGREEQLYKISTLEGSRSLKTQAPFSGNERIKSLMRSGVDLIAKEAEYHKTCRVQFDNETKQALASTNEMPTLRQCHQLAFITLKNFVEEQTTTDSLPLLILNLYHQIYQDEFVNNGGALDEFQCYSVPALVKKLRQKFGHKSVTLVNKKRGLMIYSCNISREEALARLEIGNESAQRKEQIRAVTSYLRSLILNIPKLQTPQPANITNLKESA